MPGQAFQSSWEKRAPSDHNVHERFVAARLSDPSLTWTARKTSSRRCCRMSWPLSQGLEFRELSLDSKWGQQKLNKNDQRRTCRRCSEAPLGCMQTVGKHLSWCHPIHHGEQSLTTIATWVLFYALMNDRVTSHHALETS